MRSDKQNESEEKMKSDKQNEIAKRLLRLRHNLNLTQKQFAERLSPRADYTYVGKLERGEQLPSLYFLARINRAFSVPLSYFFDSRIADLWDDYSQVKSCLNQVKGCFKQLENLFQEAGKKLDQISEASRQFRKPKGR